MKILMFFLILYCTSNFSSGQTTKKTGIASFYGKQFHGRRTANGERYDMYSKTCAHKTLPFNSLVKVTNIKNGKSTIVRINDRGPMKKSRIIDLSYFAAKDIDLVQDGIGTVQIELIELDEHEREKIGLKACCYSQLEDLVRLEPLDVYGKNIKSDSLGAEENSSKGIQNCFSDIIISPASCSTVNSAANFSNSKNKRKNRNNEYRSRKG